MAYKVKRQFTDRKGKAWKKGDHYEGLPAEVDEQMEAGNIEEVEPQEGPEGSGAAA